MVPSHRSCRADISLIFQHYDLCIQPPHFPFLTTRKVCFSFCFVPFPAVCVSAPHNQHCHERSSAPAHSPAAAKALWTDTASLGSGCDGCLRDTSPALLMLRHSTRQPCLRWWPCGRALFVVSQMALRSSQVTAWVKTEQCRVSPWLPLFVLGGEMAIYPLTLHPVLPQPTSRRSHGAQWSTLPPVPAAPPPFSPPEARGRPRAEGATCGASPGSARREAAAPRRGRGAEEKGAARGAPRCGEGGRQGRRGGLWRPGTGPWGGEDGRGCGRDGGGVRVLVPSASLTSAYPASS